MGVTANAGSDNLEAMALKTLSPAQVRNRPPELGGKILRTNPHGRLTRIIQLKLDDS